MIVEPSPTGTAIAVISVVVAVLGMAIGAFAYITGELRKVSEAARDDTERAKKAMEAHLEAVALAQERARQDLKQEVLGTISRIEADLRAAARRDDVQNLEERLTRTQERMEKKVDTLSGQVTTLVVSIAPLRGYIEKHRPGE